MGIKRRSSRENIPKYYFGLLGVILRFGDDFIDHLSGEQFKLDGTEGDDVVFSFQGKFLLIPVRHTLQRYSPAYSVTDGISKSQVRLLIQCFIHNKVIPIEKHNPSI